MPTTRKAAVARGCVGASVATFASLAGHVTFGGDMPSLIGIAVPWMLSIMVCTLLAGRAVSLVRLSLAVSVSQVLFHTLFTMGAPAGGAVVSGHAHAEVLALSPTVAVASASGPLMWLGHTIVAGVTVAALWRGERTLRALTTVAGWLMRWMPRALTLTHVPLPRRRPAITVRTAYRCAPRDALLLEPLQGRAPPRVRDMRFLRDAVSSSGLFTPLIAQRPA